MGDVTLPYYRFYPADWLGDVRIQAMTLEEEGAYHRLCAQMWELGQDCTLPDDDALLARLLRVTPEKWAELRAVLVDGPMAVLQKTADGRLTNKRLREEWDKARSKQRQAREAAESRWHGSDDADADADAYPTAGADDGAGTMPYPEAHIPRSSNAHSSRTQEEEKAPSRPPAGGAPPAISPDGVAEIWNQVCGDVLPRCQKITDKRRKHVKRRIAESAERRSPDWWRSYFARIRASPFCCGENDRGWKADFEWAVRSEDVVTKVLEGKYDQRRSEVMNGAGRVGYGPQPDPAERDFSDLYIRG